MQDFTKLKDEELEAQREKLNADRDGITEQLRAVTQEQNVRHARSQIGDVLESLPPGVRDQVLKAKPVDSTAAVGTPGK